jgi:mono/diheme cytochrome c family protein
MRVDRRGLAGLTIGLAMIVEAAAAADQPSAGATLYRRYCASCHGVAGAGDGPVAEGLSPKPTDLRRLDADVPSIMQAIDGRRTLRAHGDSRMPVWGHVLEDEKAGRRHRGRTTLHEVLTLAEYVHALRTR